MKKNPLVTIGMPVRNCSATVAEAIASILNQTLEDWELAVVDDGSQDATAEVVRRFADPRIRLFEDKTNRGLPVRLNEIVRKATSKFFARMDGDDVAYPGRLLQQVQFLERHSAVDLVGGATVVFDNDGEAMGVRRGPEKHDRICAGPLSGFPIAHPTWLGHTEWFLRHPYPEDALLMEDWALLFCAYRQSTLANLQEVVLGYREVSLSMRKLTGARWNKCRFLVKLGRADGSYEDAFSESGRQAAKLMIDALALGTGLNYRLLKHRVPPASRAEIEEWHEVRDAVNKIVTQYAREPESVSV
jgi:glycosyltransferase involved in cell wall biosynthesis